MSDIKDIKQIINDDDRITDMIKKYKDIVIVNTEETIKNIVNEKLHDMMKDTNRMNANFQEMIMKNIKEDELLKDKLQKKMNIMDADLKEIIDKHKLEEEEKGDKRGDKGKRITIQATRLPLLEQATSLRTSFPQCQQCTTSVTTQSRTRHRS